MGHQDLYLGISISVLQALPSVLALHRSDCHSSQGSAVIRAAYRNTEKVKDRKNQLLFKMEIRMNLSNAQDGRISIKIVNGCIPVQTPVEQRCVSCWVSYRPAPP